ncbi:MAG: hypothetical protein ACOY42_13310, partial [Pseudomonadota bacterium]|jgi:ribonuclease E
LAAAAAEATEAAAPEAQGVARGEAGERRRRSRRGRRGERGERAERGEQHPEAVPAAGAATKSVSESAPAPVPVAEPVAAQPESHGEAAPAPVPVHGEEAGPNVILPKGAAQSAAPAIPAADEPIITTPRVTPAETEPAAAVTPEPAKQPEADLKSVLEQSGLVLVETSPDKARTWQVAEEMPQPTGPRRRPRPPMVITDEPLVQVETRK